MTASLQYSSQQHGDNNKKGRAIVHTTATVGGGIMNVGTTSTTTSTRVRSGSPLAASARRATRRWYYYNYNGGRFVGTGGKRAWYFYLLVPVAALLCVYYYILAHTRLRTGWYHYYWRKFMHWYFRQLHISPLTTRAFSAGCIFLLADLLAQKFGGRRRGTTTSTGTAGGAVSVIPLSYGRLFRYSTYGGLVIAPILYVWYAAMNHYAPRDDVLAALCKCIFDQIFLEPVCIILYIVYDGLLTRRDWNSIMRKTRKCFLPLWVKNAIFWMPANFTNYYIATPDLRVAFSNLCSLFWNAYFSSKINNNTPNNKFILLPPQSNDNNSNNIGMNNSKTKKKIASSSHNNNNNSKYTQVTIGDSQV